MCLHLFHMCVLILLPFSGCYSWLHIIITWRTLKNTSALSQPTLPLLPLPPPKFLGNWLECGLSMANFKSSPDDSKHVLQGYYCLIYEFSFDLVRPDVGIFPRSGPPVKLMAHSAKWKYRVSYLIIIKNFKTTTAAKHGTPVLMQHVQGASSAWNSMVIVKDLTSFGLVFSSTISWLPTQYSKSTFRFSRLHYSVPTPHPYLGGWSWC